MIHYNCRMCGGPLPVTAEPIVECEYCGSRQPVPSADSEKKQTLFARANRLRLACEFDRAAAVYESIAAEFPEETEASWGIVLCRYGIEYVDDPATGKKVPTCHRSSFASVLEDADYQQTLDNADPLTRKLYHREAAHIEELRESILSVSASEKPYDIFICYKETDEGGDRTLDSVLAQDLYDLLTGKGYRVFFSRISLEDKLGREYEPYIFAALNSAKVMLAVGTCFEHYDAVWVKNEWSRFLKLMEQDSEKYLIPCYKDIDAYDMPKEFRKLQAQDLGKVGAHQDLVRGVEKLLKSKAAAPALTARSRSTDRSNALYFRGKMALAERNWYRADSFFEDALNYAPTYAKAYLGKLMADLKLRDYEELQAYNRDFSENRNFQYALQFADASFRLQLEAYLQTAIENCQQSINKAVEVLCAYADQQRYAENQFSTDKKEELKRNIEIYTQQLAEYSRVEQEAELEKATAHVQLKNEELERLKKERFELLNKMDSYQKEISALGLLKITQRKQLTTAKNDCVAAYTKLSDKISDTEQSLGKAITHRDRLRASLHGQKHMQEELRTWKKALENMDVASVAGSQEHSVSTDDALNAAIVLEENKCWNRLADQARGYAPKATIIQIPFEKDQVLTCIEQASIQKAAVVSGAKVMCGEQGKILIGAMNQESLKRAQAMIRAIFGKPEVGALYYGKVVRILNIGAFVEIAPGCDGLVHIRELDDRRPERVEDILQVGSYTWVKVLSCDERGRIELSRKAALSA